MNVRVQVFEDFTFDPVNELIWKGKNKIRLRPKTFALLKILVERPGQLVTKDELLKAVWKECHVKPEALRHCIAEIRRALGDNLSNPKYIKTVASRGYCFLEETLPEVTQESESLVKNASSVESIFPPFQLVGRVSELETLHQLLQKADGGMAQVVFIGGEQGIGKTSLVNEFIVSVNSKRLKSEKGNNDFVIARAQCFESNGAYKAYAPIIEAISALNDVVIKNHYSSQSECDDPHFLFPALPSANLCAVSHSQSLISDGRHELIAQELAEALEALSSVKTIILVLEDLHWSDAYTLDLISCFAQDKKFTRLLLIATYRTDSIATGNHLKTIIGELHGCEQFYELFLDFLKEADVLDYLNNSLTGNKFSADMTERIIEQTGGNPMFIIHLLKQWIACGLVCLKNGEWEFSVAQREASQIIPQTTRRVIEAKLERLTLTEQKFLKAASVEGTEFSADGVAACIGETVNLIVETFTSLAGRGLFVKTSEAEHAGRYRFISAVYQQTCYQLLSERLRARYHIKIAQYIEKRNSNQEKLELRLALHYNRGHNSFNALKYYVKAAEDANSRFAGFEAANIASQGLQLLSHTPERSEFIELEARLYNALGTGLMSVQANGSSKSKHAFRKSRDLLNMLGKKRQAKLTKMLFASIHGLFCYHRICAEYSAAHGLAKQLLQLAEVNDNPVMLDRAHCSWGSLLLDYGDFCESLAHLEKCSNIAGNSLAAVALCIHGYPDKALFKIRQIVARADEFAGPEDIIFSNLCAARVYMERRDIVNAAIFVKIALKIALQHKREEPWLAPIRIHFGWILAKLGQKQAGIEQMVLARDALCASGMSNLKPLLLCLFADILLDIGKVKEGLGLIDEGLDFAYSTGMNHCNAELYRLRANLMLAKIHSGSRVIGSDSKMLEIVSCLEQAIEISHEQRAKLFEIRAATSLTKHFIRQGRNLGATRCLKRIFSQFTEGFETSDLQEASKLLRNINNGRNYLAFAANNQIDI